MIFSVLLAMASANVGEPVWKDRRYEQSQYAISQADFAFKRGLFGGRYNIPAGTRFEGYSVLIRRFCLDDDAAEKIKSSYWKFCINDEDEDGLYEDAEKAYEVEPPVALTIHEERVPGPPAAESVLVFTGIDGETLRLSYREFANGMARPAFTEDLTFPMTGYPQTIRYRDVAIQLLGYGENGLEFELVD